MTIKLKVLTLKKMNYLIFLSTKFSVYSQLILYAYSDDKRKRKNMITFFGEPSGLSIKVVRESCPDK